MGGWSTERGVSRSRGEGIGDACESRGHRVTRIDMDRDVALRLAEAKPDIVFNALHGVPGDDGTVQGMLDLMSPTSTHSGLVTMLSETDKQLTQTAHLQNCVRNPKWDIVDRAIVNRKKHRYSKMESKR